MTGSSPPQPEPARAPLAARLKNLLPRGGFARAVAIVSGGTAIGQILTIVASPLLSRLYVPADFGTLALYAAPAGIIAMVGGLAYQLAVPVPEDDEGAVNVLALSLAAFIATAGLGALALLVFYDRLVAWHRLAPLSWLLWLIPLGGLGIGSFEALSQWAVRRRSFGTLAKTSVARASGQLVIQSGWGLWAPSATGLVVGQLAGQWLGTITLLRLAWRHFKHVSLRRVVAVAKRYRRFPLLTLPEVTINAVSYFAPPLLLAFFFGSSVLGFYALQDRVTQVPIRLVGSSAQRVFFSSAAEASRENRLAELTRTVFGQMLDLGVPFVALLAAAAPSAFSIIFGDPWREAGVYAQWLCIRTALTMVVFPLTPLVYVLEKQWAGTAFQGVLLVCRVGPIIAGGLMGSPRTAIALSGVCIGVAWVLYLVFLTRLSGNRVLTMLAPAARSLLYAAALTSPLLVVRLFAWGDLAITATAALLGTVALIVLVRKRKRPQPNPA